MKLHKKIHFLLLTTAIVLFGINTSWSQEITGTWFNEEKNSKIEVYKTTANTYVGKIVWLKEPDRDGKPKTDINNPKSSKQNEPLMGLFVLRGFTKKSDSKYDGGTIYDPRSGKTYDCTITVVNANELSMRGYVGLSMFGKSTTWTRAN